MSDVRRLFSRRDKKHPRNKSASGLKDVPKSTQSTNKPTHFGNVFSIEDDPKAHVDKEEERSIVGILERLRSYGIQTMVESNARYALRVHKGDAEEAFKLLMLLQETYEGLVKSFDPSRAMAGAINREGVTCYLDALLFAMFMRLDSFEAMLYDSLEDPNKRKLAAMLRLWVNMLRTGRLITTDVTRNLQEALANCGWEDAARLRQQDPSEAFTFITDQLQLPLLTLKMDLYHTGKDDPTDDHKFINERLLEVAILESPPEGRSTITLEDCLEHYFNNRIEVKRHLENQRRNTLKSATSGSSSAPSKVEKESGLHVEIVEVPGTPLVQTPISEEHAFPPRPKDPLEKLRPGTGRKRQDSIFSQRKIAIDGIDPEKPEATSDIQHPERKMSTKTEVLMPAWQFFKLLPWYTDHMPTSDAQVAAHFAKKRPVLGICLKRYSFTTTGQAQRLDTFVDIPLEIQVPNFLSDEQMQNDIDHHTSPVGGNFRLLLQSVVCHRGVSVHSGHYITLCRGTPTLEQRQRQQQQEQTRSESSSISDDLEQFPDPWVRFDDLAPSRVTQVDIHEALRKETPYLLFYQVQPIGEDGREVHDLPSYAEATSRSQSEVNHMIDMVKSDHPYLHDASSSENGLTTANSGTGLRPGTTAVGDAIDSQANRLSAETDRGRASLAGTEERRQSVAFDEASFKTEATTPSLPATPSEEKLTNTLSAGSGNTFLNVAARMSGGKRGTSRAKTGSKDLSTTTTNSDETVSPPAVPEKEGRFSLNMAKLTQRISRGALTTADKDTAREASLPPPTVRHHSATAGSATSDGTEASLTHALGGSTHSITSAHLPVTIGQEAPAPASERTLDALPTKQAGVTALPPAPADSKHRSRGHKVSKRGQAQEDRDCRVM